MKALWNDLKGRAPFRVGVLYAGISLAVVLLAQMVLPAAGAPDWSVNLVAVTLFIPFPFVVILAWALTAEPPEEMRAPRRHRSEITGGPPRER